MLHFLVVLVAASLGEAHYVRAGASGGGGDEAQVEQVLRAIQQGLTTMVELLTDKNQLLERNHDEIERALGGNFAAIEERQEVMETLLLRLQKKCSSSNPSSGYN